MTFVTSTKSPGFSPFSQECQNPLIELAWLVQKAQSAAEHGKNTQVLAFLECAGECIDELRASLEPMQMSLSLATPVSSDEKCAEHLVATPCGTDGIYRYICELLKTKEIGYRFNFVQVADWVGSAECLALDQTHAPADRRQKWRKYVSRSLEKLRRLGFIEQAEKSRNYILANYPHTGLSHTGQVRN